MTYNIVTVIAGLMGHLSPLAAAILMPLSSVVTLGIVALTFAVKKPDREAVTLVSLETKLREVC